jgi:hypothetical protein
MKTRDVKATRKVHTCEICREPIPAGDAARSRSEEIEGEWQNFYRHVDCREEGGAQ